MITEHYNGDSSIVSCTLFASVVSFRLQQTEHIVSVVSLKYFVFKCIMKRRKHGSLKCEHTSCNLKFIKSYNFMVLLPVGQKVENNLVTKYVKEMSVYQRNKSR